MDLTNAERACKGERLRVMNEKLSRGICWIDSPTERFEAPTVLALIEGVYRSRPEMARKILRAPIYSNFGGPTRFEWGLIKTAAKRARFGMAYIPHEKLNGVSFNELPAPPPPEVPGLELGRKVSAEEAIHFAKLLSLSSPTLKESLLYKRDQRIGAVLVSEGGEILGWHLNLNHAVRTHHAELNLLRHFFWEKGQNRPPNSEIVVTMEPCLMCSGALT